MGLFNIFSKPASIRSIAKKLRISEPELMRIIKAADEGYSWANARLSNLEESGFTPEDYHAVRLAIYLPAANSGDPDSQCWMGLISDDFETSRIWYEKAAAQGYTKAMMRLAIEYYTRSEPENEVYWYRQAAEHGDPEGMYFLASEYRTGSTIEKDKDAALKLLQKSAELGFEKAYGRLSEIYGYYNEEHDDSKLLEYCCKAIKAQDREVASTGAFQLALYYGGSVYFGRETNNHTDIRRAMYWFHQAYFFNMDDSVKVSISEFASKSGYIVSEDEYEAWLEENESDDFSLLPQRATHFC